MSKTTIVVVRLGMKNVDLKSWAPIFDTVDSKRDQNRG